MKPDITKEKGKIVKKQNRMLMVAFKIIVSIIIMTLALLVIDVMKEDKQEPVLNEVQNGK